MKFIIYILLFYLVYRWFLKPLFLGAPQNDPLDKRKQNPIQDKQQGARKDNDDDAEYIDYEEVE